MGEVALPHSFWLLVGTGAFFPDGMRAFERGIHDALILDDVRYLEFPAAYQGMPQGKNDVIVEFGSSPCGVHAYSRFPYRIPCLATINFSTSATRGAPFTWDYLTENGSCLLQGTRTASRRGTSQRGERRRWKGPKWTASLARSCAVCFGRPPCLLGAFIATLGKPIQR